MNEALIRQDFQALDAGKALLQADAQEDQAELVELAIGIGALQAFDLVKTFTSAAQVKLFKRIRESKQINKLCIRGQDGGVKTFHSMREACPVLFGRTYESMRDAEDCFGLLGEDVYEAAARLRLNDSALRAARALPPEKLEVVRLAIANGSTKAEVLSVIEDLAEKAQLAEAAATEAKAELKASEEVLATKNKTIDRLQRDLKRIEKLPPDEQLAGIKKEAIDLQSETIGLVRGGLRQALIKLNDAPDDASKVAFMAGLVGAVYVELDALREEFGLSLAAVDTTPEWERWANAQGANAGAIAGTAAN